MLDEHISEVNAESELRRADHLFFVTLKYTRTCDVIKSIIRRLINAYDLAIIDALYCLKKKKKIKEIPLTPISRIESLRNSYKKIEMIDFINFYFLLRFIDKAEYTKREEFKRHVTLTVMQDDEAIEIDIDKIKEYFEKTKEFVDYVREKFK
ncbi:MAG: hypothetical protein ISS82_03955 [Nanoarchaeota archaeon]|nr:hypothetical protein [Nanoarchaeota archaeon]